jgi:hypothetical protein
VKPARFYQVEEVDLLPFSPCFTITFRLNQTAWTISGDSKFEVLRRGARIAHQLAGVHAAEELRK